MDGAVLMSAMSGEYPAPLPLSRYEELAPRWDEAMLRASCTTVQRVAMAAAQLGAESGSLRWTEELGTGEEYNGRQDLGNIYPGDGPRFKGRGAIQITGRANYTELSVWAHEHGYVPTSTYFVDNPTELAADAYLFLGFIWYWTVARPQMNALADAGNIDGATYAVNGGYNNLTGRTERWRHALTLGVALLPGHPPAPQDHYLEADMPTLIIEVDPADCAAKHVREPGWFTFNGFTLRHITSPAQLYFLVALGFPVAKHKMSVNEYRNFGGR